MQRDIKEIESWMDLSNLCLKDPLLNLKHRKQLNRFKIETPSHDIIDAVALRSKVYALRCKKNI